MPNSNSASHTHAAEHTGDEIAGNSEILGISEFKKKSISGAVSYMVRSLFLYSIGIGTALVLGAYLSPEAFGIYGLATQIVGLLQFFTDVGLGPTLIQKKEQPSVVEYRTVFTVQQLLTWLLFLMVCSAALLGWVPPKIGSEGLWVLLALSISLPLSSLKVISAIILERKLDFSKLVIPSLFEQIVYNIVLLLMVLQGSGIISYAYAVLVRTIVGVIVMWCIQPWSVGLAFDKNVIREMVRIGLKFQASDLLAKIKDQIFYLLLGWWLPAREFGYITWSKSWSQVPCMLTVQNVIAITFPAYARLQHDKNLVKKAIEKSIFFITLAIFPLLIGMSAMMGPFIQLVPKYEKWQPALFTYILMTLSIGWAAVSTPLTNTLNAMGKVNQTLKLMSMWTILTWTITPLCIKLLGFNGVATAAMIISFTSIIPILMVKKLIELDIWNNIKSQFLGGCLMAILGVALQTQMSVSWGWFITGGLVLSASYTIVVLGLDQSKVYAECKSLLKKS